MDQKIILIDEIENGLHHTLYKKIILMMLKYVHEHQIQIFITTHSKEVLENLAEALKKNKDYQKNFSHYTLSISNNKNYAYRHNYEELEGTLKSTFDLRDE